MARCCAQRRIGCRPAGRQGVASEPDNVATVCRDCVNELFEVDIEQAAHFFRAGRTARGEAFSQWSGAGDVSKEDCSGKAVGCGLCEPTRGACAAAHEQRRNIARVRLEEVRQWLPPLWRLSFAV